MESPPGLRSAICASRSNSAAASVRRASRPSSGWAAVSLSLSASSSLSDRNSSPLSAKNSLPAGQLTELTTSGSAASSRRTCRAASVACSGVGASTTASRLLSRLGNSARRRSSVWRNRRSSSSIAIGSLLTPSRLTAARPARIVKARHAASTRTGCRVTPVSQRSVLECWFPTSATALGFDRVPDMRDDRLEVLVSEDALVLRALDRQVADTVGNDGDDLPLRVVAGHHVVERDLPAAAGGEPALDHGAILALLPHRNRIEGFTAEFLELTGVGGRAEV